MKKLCNRYLPTFGRGFQLAATVLCLLLATQTAIAQGTVTQAKGVVVDTKGAPLPGVTIMIKGTSFGTSSDKEGKFSINVQNHKNPLLVFSFIGMSTQELKPSDKPMRIVMVEKASDVKDVVVTGYQQIDRRELSSSIVSVKGADLILGATSSLDQMLQGRLAGVAVMNQSSTPGVAPKIRIRGSSSITGNREPVWVVDGVILDEPVQIPAEQLNSLDNVNLIGNAISFLNPEDIDRIDILKDASATAIYGVKAANGVIVVTTKKGTKGVPRINYTTSLTITRPPTYKSMMRMNSAERIEMSQEMQERGLQFGSNNPADVGYEGALLELWDKQISYDQFLHKVTELKQMNTDWYDLLFRQAFSQQHSISVSGGTEKTSYYVSGGFSDDRSVTRGESVTRYTAMANINTQINKKVRLGVKLSGSLTQTKRPHTSVDPYEYAYSTSRAISPDQFYSKSQGYNANLPYNILNEMDHSGSETDNQFMGINVTLDWNIAKWIKYSGLVSASRNSNYQTYWADEQSYYISKLRQTPYGEPLPNLTEHPDFATRTYLPFGGELKNTDTRNTSYTVRNSFALMHKFGQRHEVSGNIGTEIRSSLYKGLTSTGYGYLPDRGKKFVQIPTSVWTKYAEMLEKNPDVITDTKNNVLSYYGTFSYVFDNRYVANFNIRADGSNKFGQDKSVRFLPVWSVSARWNIMNEKFMGKANERIINELAVRASYGIQGNVHPDQTPNLILNMGTLDPTSQEYASTLYKLANDKLKWEKTKAYNVAVDFGFLDSRIFGSIDIYYKKGVDQVVQKEVAPSMGADKVSINAGDVENKGWDLSVSIVPIVNKNWTWSITLNTGKNYNKVLNVGNPTVSWSDYISGNLISNGTAINSFYAYKFAGLDNQGLPTFNDIYELDETGKKLSQSQQEAFDRAFIYAGRREADLTGGFSTMVKFKRVTFNALFSFSIGNKIRLNELYSSSGQQLPHPEQNMSDEFVGRWRNPGDQFHTNIPVLSDNSLQMADMYRTLFNTREIQYEIGDNLWDMYNNSDLRVVSGNFLRCRSMSLRYDFNPELLKKIYLKSLSISFDAGNVFVIKDSALKGRDPEQVSLGSHSIPPQRTYSIRLNIGF